jgi:hypothetical protein
MRWIASQPPDLLTQPPGLHDALGVGHLHPELEVVTIGFGCVLIASNGDPRSPR